LELLETWNDGGCVRSETWNNGGRVSTLSPPGHGCEEREP